MVKEGNKRIDAVNVSANATVLLPTRSLLVRAASIIQPGGNAYTNRRMAACLRDMDILRYVTYALMAGDSSVLDDRCLNGLREHTRRGGVPGGSTMLVFKDEGYCDRRQ